MRFRFTKKKLAQAAIEVAVFGAILLYILSVIVRQAYNANFTQNQSLRVLRMAMTQSHDTSFKISPARNIATIIVLEDHLTPSLNKYGPNQRTPFVMSGSATHSSQLFQPPTYGAITELPRLDMFINGQHFQFTMAGYKVVSNLHVPGSPAHPDWDPNCVYRTNLSTAPPTIEWAGCRRFYKSVANYVSDPEKNDYCCADCPGTGTCVNDRCCDTTKNLPAAERFDLDHDSSNNPTGVVPQVLWPDFAWQWYLVKAASTGRSRPTLSPLATAYSINYGEDIVSTDDVKKNVYLDVDSDYKSETILGADHINPTGVFSNIYVLDSQEGDLDFTGGSNETGPRPGLQDDVKMYTFVRDESSVDGGTFFLIEEGKLYDPLDTRRFVRNVQKRDAVDLIERVIRLSNDTGRFCNWAGMTPFPTVDFGTALAHPNPVEACADNCFQTLGATRNVDLTCMVRNYNIIYVRSRLKDLGGKKWVTPTAP